MQFYSVALTVNTFHDLWKCKIYIFLLHQQILCTGGRLLCGILGEALFASNFSVILFLEEVWRKTRHQIVTSVFQKHSQQDGDIFLVWYYIAEKCILHLYFGRIQRRRIQTSEQEENIFQNKFTGSSIVDKGQDNFFILYHGTKRGIIKNYGNDSTLMCALCVRFEPFLPRTIFS